MEYKWIKTENELPNNPNWVIVYLFHDGFEEVFPGYYNSGQWFNDIQEKMNHKPVQWTRLPRPPTNINE
jgi:hypothetical protein